MEKNTNESANKTDAKSKKAVTVGDANKKRNIVIAVIAVLAVVAVILGVVVATNSGKDDEGAGTNGGSNLNQDNKVDDYGNTEIADGETKVAGDDTYGYVTIPKSWNEVPVDDGEGLQWGDTKNKYFVSLLVADADELSAEEWAEGMEMVFEQRNITDVETTKQKLGDLGEAYVVTGYYKAYSRWLAAYIIDVDDKVYYISVEGPEKDNNIFEIPNTFKLKK